MPSGYCSDETRMYAVGQPDAEFVDVLRGAARGAGGCGGACAARRHRASRSTPPPRRSIADAGYGDRFIHRTGHGIGLETHEEPYIVAGQRRAAAPGMAFSVEPGIYLPGRHGARIEDIVVVTDRTASSR